MSAENVEIVRRAVEATQRRPKPDFTTVNALFDPTHEFVSRLSGVEGATFHGARGFREWLTNMAEAWESWEWKLERVTDIDDDRVLVAAGFSGRSRMGGVPLKVESAIIVTVRDGKIARSEGYPSVEQALEAVGLSA